MAYTKYSWYMLNPCSMHSMTICSPFIVLWMALKACMSGLC